MTITEMKKQYLAELEWEFFTTVKNAGGRASCQDDRATFLLMRKSQFSPWPEELVDSYTADLKQAKEEGRNPLSEKYAWMMQDTAPAEFERLRHLLPPQEITKELLIEEIVTQETLWFKEYAAAYPRISAGNRQAELNRSSIGNTSMATYLKGELRSYSRRTVELYAQMIRTLKKEGKNICLLIMDTQMKGYGFDGLDDAENRIDR